MLVVFFKFLIILIVFIIDFFGGSRGTVGDLFALVGACILGFPILRVAVQDRPDLILMDLNMPEMDGFTSTRKIRALEHALYGQMAHDMGRPSDNRVPIIAMTANALPADRERCLQSGMND